MSYLGGKKKEKEEEEEEEEENMMNKGSKGFMGCEKEPTKLHSDGEGEKQPDDGSEDEMWRNYIGLTVDDVVGKEFQFFQDAYTFYCNYTKCCGFVVRKDDVGKNKSGDISGGNMCVTEKEERNKKHLMKSDTKREHSPLTRTKCTVKICVNLEESNRKWITSQFNSVHNHDLTQLDLVSYMTGYQKMKDADKAQANATHDASVRTSHIFGFLVDQAGGYAGLSFCKKDLYNHIDKEK